MVTQTDLGKLTGSQNKAKRDEGKKGDCREVRGSIGQKGGKRVGGENNQNIRHTCVRLSKCSINFKDENRKRPVLTYVCTYPAAFYKEKARTPISTW